MMIKIDKHICRVVVDDTFPDMTVCYYATYPVDDFLEGYYSDIKSFEIRDRDDRTIKDVTMNSDTLGYVISWLYDRVNKNTVRG